MLHRSLVKVQMYFTQDRALDNACSSIRDESAQCSRYLTSQDLRAWTRSSLVACLSLLYCARSDTTAEGRSQLQIFRSEHFSCLFCPIARGPTLMRTQARSERDTLANIRRVNIH